MEDKTIKQTIDNILTLDLSIFQIDLNRKKTFEDKS